VHCGGLCARIDWWGRYCTTSPPPHLASTPPPGTAWRGNLFCYVASYLKSSISSPTTSHFHLTFIQPNLPALARSHSLTINPPPNTINSTSPQSAIMFGWGKFSSLLAFVSPHYNPSQLTNMGRRRSSGRSSAGLPGWRTRQPGQVLS